jgi:hypothetical protein
MLDQIDKLTYSFWAEEPSFTVSFTEDLDARTNRSVRGFLSAEVSVFR